MVLIYGLLPCGSALFFATLLIGQRLSCPTNCIGCSNNRACERCKDGFYNGHQYDDPRLPKVKDCSFKCSDNCEACTSFKNCTKCKPGFCIDHEERQCSKKCEDVNANCELCTSCDVCTKCKIWFYGKTCTERCSYGCKDARCYITNGYCTCRKNFKGDKCDRCISGKYGNNCDKSCAKGCKTNMCDMQSGACVTGCKPGFKPLYCLSCVDEFFLNGDTCEKCPNACLRCTTSNNCSECKPRSWGHICQQTCSSKCFDQICNDNSSCRNCTEGLYGESCEFRCPKTCATKSCRRDGICFVCKEGHFGVNCTNRCPFNCKGNCDFDGHCRSCIDGYFGNVCDNNCPENCCSCISRTHCTNCKPGFRGTICEHECSNCRSGTKCGQQDGYCEEDCADGLSGPMCDQTCLKQCKTCDRKSNFICLSCIYGKYGRYASKGISYLTCTLNCSQNCLNSSCNGEDGRCLHGCVQRFRGAYCNTTCPTNCKNGKCVGKDRVCAKGCKEGFFGRKCSRRCNLHDSYCSVCLTDENGLYVACTMCKKGHFPRNNVSDTQTYKRCGPCSLNCLRNECNTTNGFCQHSCKTGFWGIQCEKTCDYNCVGCEQYNGDCLICSDGRYGIKCLENCNTNCGRKNGIPVCSRYDGLCLSECTQGFHGQLCDMPCSKNCANNTCNKLGGDCSIGCLPGFDGTTCTQVSNGINKDVIIAISSALVIGILLFIVVVCIKVHKRKGTTSSMEMEEQNRNMNGDDAGLGDANSRANMSTARRTEHRNMDDIDVETRLDYANISSNTEICLTKFDASEEVEIDSYEDEKLRRVQLTQTAMFAINDDGTYYNTAAVLKRRITLDKLKEFVSKKTKEDFIKEFQELPVGLIKPYEASQTTENLRKNRYQGLYPYDKRRVVIKEGKGDYINASYIDGHNRRNAYIACMGPTIKHMGADFAVFWEMIWQDNVDIIVMLTNLTELGVPKCDKYWPDRKSQEMCGDVKVTCIAEDISTDYTIRTISIKKREQKRKLFQMHFTSWPDKGIPQSAQSLTEFQKCVNKLDIAGSGPIVVHCSAGIGRTGTYIALDILTKEGRSENYVDIFACVRNMREDRVHMIQTADQYIFLHESLVHVLTG